MFLAKKLNKGAGSPAPAADAQFNYVTMLLHGDGTNGAQNNTFLDSSTNNFTITRNGNTTQGSFSPYGANWSNYIGGTGNWLATNSSITLNGDFTAECWFNPSSLSFTPFFSVGDDINASGFTFFMGATTGQIRIYSNATFVLDTGVYVTANTWNHVATVRSSNTVRVYFNGVDSGVTWSTSQSFSGVVTIGAERYNGSVLSPMTGYLSNLRITTSTVYTSNFTPSTTPLTAISGTSLLTCQSNRFIDNSTNNFAITVNGTPSVQRFNPFGASTAYSTSVIGGSGYFSEATTGLAVNNSSCMVFSGDFTIEAWCYQFSTDSKVVCGQLSTSNFQIQFNRSGIAGRTGIYNNSVWTTLDCSSSPVNQWFHLAYSRSGSDVYIYLNGVSQGTISVSGTLSFSGVNGGGIGALAGYWAGGWVGYISSFQSSNVAKYTGSNFTPPTAPPTAVSSTTVLANMTNGAIYDNAMMNDLETVDNAQISTSVVKYGTGSIYFDGAGDYLLSQPIQSNSFGTGDFTIECWAHVISFGSYRTLVCVGDYGNSSGVIMYISGVGELRIYADGFSEVISSSTISLNTWYHFAATRSNGTVRVFIDGTLTGSGTITANITGTQTRVGKGIYTGILDAEGMYGYIDDLRITKGYARYTATFTPPTAAFPNIGPV